MADINSLKRFLGDVANAIREKDGIAGNIYPKDFDNRIRNISSGGKVDNLYSFSFRNGTATSYDNSITSINTNCVQNLDNAFYNCQNLTNLSEFNTSNVKSMKNMLYNCNKLSNQSLNNLCNLLPLYNNITDSTKINRLTYLGLLESQIANIPEEFVNIAEAKGWNLSQLLEYLISYDTGNGNTIYYNLKYNKSNEGNNGLTLRNYLRININPTQCYNLEIKNIDNITDFNGMFVYFHNLYSIKNIENLVSSNVVNITKIFCGCNRLVSNIPNWNISKCNDLTAVFNDASNIIGTLPNWDTSNIEYWGTEGEYGLYIHGAFRRCNRLTGHIPNWNTKKSKSLHSIFLSCQNLTGSIPNFNLSNCLDMKGAFLSCQNLTGSIPNFNLSNCLTLNATFQNCYNLTGTIPNFSLNTSNGVILTNTFRGCNKLIGSIPNLQGKIRQINSCFANCQNLTGNIPNLDLSYVNSIDSCFANCKNLTGNIPSFNLSNNCKSIALAFYDCGQLSGISNLNVQNVQNFALCFYEAMSQNLGSIPNFNTSNGINFYGMFSNYGYLAGWNTSIENYSDGRNIELWNLNNATNIDRMFESAKIRMNIENFILPPKVTSLASTFAWMRGLTGNIPNWNTKNISNFSYVFGDYPYAGYWPNWDTSNGINFRYTFKGCKNMIGNVPNYNLTKATDVSHMFCYVPCNLSNFDLSNVVYMNSFAEHTPMVSLPNWNLNKVQYINNAFALGKNLKDVPQYNLSSAVNMGQMFAYCNNLTNTSINNIINMCIAAVNVVNKNLMTTSAYSPLAFTKFNNSYYTAYHSQLRAAGWTF